MFSKRRSFLTQSSKGIENLLILENETGKPKCCQASRFWETKINESKVLNTLKVCYPNT